MSDPKKVAVGVVITGPNSPHGPNVVPFDDDVHPHVKAHILKYLTETGHAYEPIAGKQHVRLVSGPHKK